VNVEYDAFVSYSHESDREFAPALKAGVEKLAKPWNRLRALRLFLDTASLSADPALWNSIEEALERSSWFVLITSTSAARSRWVERELAWWLEHRSVDRLLLVVTEGELAWEGDRFDTERSTALPPILRTAFPQEPRWVDSRETDAVAEVAATLRGIPKDELVGEAVRQHRRTMRVARTAIAALATLLALAVVAAILALGQRNTAREQARIATARQLASVSTRELTSNLDIALLLAVQAERMDPSPQTRSALLQAATASPALVRYLQASGQVTQVAGSGDGKTIVAGLDDGRVQRFGVANARRETLFDLPGSVTGLAVSRDGATVVATDGTRARLREGDATSAPFAAYSVGLSPSGRTLVFREGQPFDPGTISVVDVPRRTLRGTHPASFLPHTGTATVLLASSDDELLLLDGGYGYWQRRRISDWAVEAEGRGSFGAQHLSGTPSANGAFFSASNGGQPISVWPTDRARRPLTAEAPIASGRAPALSPDGSRLAVPDSGQVYVAAVAPATAQHPAPVQLTGMGSTNVDGLAFIGDAGHLVSATRDKLALWDLGQLDRLGRPRELPVGSSCNACDGPAVTVSPDGRRAAIIDGGQDKALILPLAGGRTEHLPDLHFAARYTAAVWVANRLALPLEGETGPESLPPSVRGGGGGAAGGGGGASGGGGVAGVGVFF
jgi:hypothetical protein